MSEAVELDDVIAFLLGQKPLDGRWFGDPVLVSQDKPYWWRHALRKAWNALTNPPEGEPDWAVSKDGPHEIGDQRRWLARQLMDSKLTDDEAFGIVCYHPNISDLWKAWKAKAKPPEGEPVAWRVRVADGWPWHLSDDPDRQRDAGWEVQPLYTRPVAWPDREAVIACIRDAADRAFEAGRQGDIHFRFGDIIARADALLSGGGE